MKVINNTLPGVTNNLFFDSLKIYGYPEQINSVSLNGQILNSAITTADIKEKVFFR